ncbi:MAG TPA: APC family permease [Candidatus Bathyarchaeia archaeon]|nr:APC family permease [Candidatus Bathyarchaeia archaeon]
MASNQPKIFLREASGLLRSLTGFEGALIALSQLNFVMGLMELYAWGSVTVSSANYALSILVSVPLVSILGILYVLFGIMMPRSGGDYVWVSRALHPSLGLMVSTFMTFLALAWTGLNAWLVGSVLLPGFLFAIGYPSLATVVAQPMNSFIIALICIAAFTVAFIPRTKVVALILKVLFVATLVGWAALALTAIFPTWTLGQVLQTQYNVNPSTLISTAQTSGYVPGWTMVGSLAALPWAMQMWGGFWWAPYAGGEIQNPKKSMWVAVLGATYISIILYTILIVVIPNAFGFDLPIALNYLYGANPSAYPAALPPPYLGYLFAMVTNNTILRDLGGFAWLASILFIIPSGYFVVTRNFFAWSFDRVFPEPVASVSERFHTPVVSTIVTGILLGVMAYLTAFTGFWGYLVNLMMGLNFAFIIVAIAAIVFPYKKKELFQKSPIANWKFMNIPIVSLVGVAALLVSGYLEYTVLLYPALGGAITWTSIGSVVGVFALGLVIYFVYKGIRARQGIDLSLVFGEIPPA